MMHQDVFLQLIIDEYWYYHFSDLKTIDSSIGNLYGILRNIAARVVKPAVEYADDDTDPLEYTDVGSAEGELDSIFDELDY